MSEKKLKPKLMPDESVSTRVAYHIKGHGRLGRQLRIGLKSQVTINHPGHKIEFLRDSVSLLIGIGKDHVAYLVMDTDAWKAFKEGEAIDVDRVTESFL